MKRKTLIEQLDIAGVKDDDEIYILKGVAGTNCNYLKKFAIVKEDVTDVASGELDKDYPTKILLVPEHIFTKMTGQPIRINEDDVIEKKSNIISMLINVSGKV